MNIPREELPKILGRLYTALEKHTDIGRNNTLVAGGCIRDYLNHRPIKDIDILLPSDVALAGVQFDSAGITDMKCEVEKDYLGENSNPNLECVLKCKFEGYDIDILCVKDISLEQYIHDTFDYGICKVWFDPKQDKIIRTPAYERDVRNRTLTLCIEGNKDQGKHYQKLKAKYQGWRPTCMVGTR